MCRQTTREIETKAQIEKKIQTKTYRRNQKDRETCQSRGQKDTDPNEDEDTKINGLYLYFKTYYDCQLAIVVDDTCTTSIINDTSKIVIYKFRVTLQIVASLTDDSRGIIYNHDMFIVKAMGHKGLQKHREGNTKGESFTVPLTSCLTGLDQSVLQINTKNVCCHTTFSKPVKQEVNSKAILSP